MAGNGLHLCSHSFYDISGNYCFKVLSINYIHAMDYNLSICEEGIDIYYLKFFIQSTTLVLPPTGETSDLRKMYGNLDFDLTALITNYQFAIY